MLPVSLSFAVSHNDVIEWSVETAAQRETDTKRHGARKCKQVKVVNLVCFSAMAARCGMMQCSHRLQMKDEKVVSELKRLRDQLGASYGPLGRYAHNLFLGEFFKLLSRLSLLCPFTGAALTVTNRSGKILQLVKSRNPVIKMILSSLQLHCQHYREAGLYATLLANRWDEMLIRLCVCLLFDFAIHSV